MTDNEEVQSHLRSIVQVLREAGAGEGEAETGARTALDLVRRYATEPTPAARREADVADRAALRGLANGYCDLADELRRLPPRARDAAASVLHAWWQSELPDAAAGSPSAAGPGRREAHREIDRMERPLLQGEAIFRAAARSLAPRHGRDGAGHRIWLATRLIGVWQRATGREADQSGKGTTTARCFLEAILKLADPRWRQTPRAMDKLLRHALAERVRLPGSEPAHENKATS